MPTQTPNIGLQVPSSNQVNWQVQINYDLNLLDLILGGAVQIPGLDVVDLTVENFSVANFSALLAAAFVSEAPTGSAPTSTYTLTNVPAVLLSVTLNGIFLTPSVDYTIAGAVITLTQSTAAGDKVFATYFKTT
jgi:hypothetical protein